MRSSSYGAWDWCQHKFMLTYVLGMREASGWKAERGNMVHKALELLARKKVAQQQGEATFSEGETGLTFNTADFEQEEAIRIGFDYYAKKNESGRDWSEADFRDVRGWTWDVLLFRDGMFNPLNRDVLAPEQFFDMVIDEPWATYSYLDPHTGKVLEGRLAIKGTIDLVTQAGPGIVEYVDWKTGLRRDWGKDREKTWAMLLDDAQLLLYFYALTKLYPEAETVFVTIFYAQDGGPFVVPFEKKDTQKFLAKLRKRFEVIRNTQVPRRIIGDAKKRWKCEKLCDFYKHKHPESGLSVCDHMHDAVVTLGLDRVIKKYGKPGAYSSYGSGGGVSNREGT